MSKAKEVKLHIKVVTNKEKTKVLFAEAGSDFTDVLLSVLLLPLGTIVEVFDKHYGDKAPVIGSLNTLYKAAKNLDVVHFRMESYKKCVTNSILFDNELSRLRLNIRGTQPKSSNSGKPYEGVFTNGAASFIITDDLCMFPIAERTIIETLSTLGIPVEDMDGMETRNVTFGLNEIIALLKETLISSNPFTAFIFPGRRVIVATEGHVFSLEISSHTLSMNQKKAVLNVLLQQSTNKFLFAQADCVFLNFLFTLLNIPLGKIEWYLGRNTGLKTIDNLHEWVTDKSNPFRTGSYISNPNRMLTNPELGSYFSNNDYIYLNIGDTGCHYVKRGRMYMVSDDLTVSPLGLASGLSVINELGISLSDIKEVKLQVGLIEGLSILKAALTSNTALTDGLINPFLKKQEIEQ